MKVCLHESTMKMYLTEKTLTYLIISNICFNALIYNKKKQLTISVLKTAEHTILKTVQTINKEFNT